MAARWQGLKHGLGNPPLIGHSNGNNIVDFSLQCLAIFDYQRVKNARKRRWESQVWGSTQLKVMVIAVQSGSSTYTPIVLVQWCKCFGSHRHAIDCGMWENLILPPWAPWGWKSTCLKPASNLYHLGHMCHILETLLPYPKSFRWQNQKNPHGWSCVVGSLGSFFAAKRNIPSFSGQQPFKSPCVPIKNRYLLKMVQQIIQVNIPHLDLSHFGKSRRLSKSKSTIFCWPRHCRHSPDAVIEGAAHAHGGESPGCVIAKRYGYESIPINCL